jgi:NAD(P)-dependent dehydrogenase (short-subunit alcohol dehydrogenase family)
MLPCDLSDAEQIAAHAERFAEAELLVLNAGMAGSAPLHKTSLADWDAHFALNARGLFACMQAAMPAMKQRGFGRIVVVASTAAKVGVPYTAAYTASKHAALGLVRAAASECAGSGVTINAVCPTFVRSEMTERSIDNLVAKTGRNREDALRALESMSPLGRLVEPDEVAHTVAFLCSQGAAPIHAQAIVLDGGGIQS